MTISMQDPMLPLDAVRRDHVRTVLELCHGHRTETARRLGIDRKTLTRMLARWASTDEP